MKTVKISKNLLAGGLLTLLVVVWAGCAAFFPPVEDPTRFYVLGMEAYTPVSEVSAEAVVVGLGRVRVARYLEDPGIAVRRDGNRIAYSQRHRWAEGLEHGLTRLLTENLHEEAVVARVAPHPVQRRPLPDYDLNVSVSRADGVISPETGPHAVFRAAWELRAGVDSEVIASGQVRADRLPWNGEDFEQLVASLSEGMAELTQQVARALEGERPEAR
jgi:uncharacterized lipoprotein YmbA